MSALLDVRYTPDANSGPNTADADLAALRAAIAANRGEIWEVQIRARKPRTGAPAAGGKWPKDPIAVIGVIDPETIESRAAPATVDEIAESVERVCETHRAGTLGYIYRVTLHQEDGTELAAIGIAMLDEPETTGTLKSATAELAHEFTMVASCFGTTLQVMHGLYRDAQKDNQTLVKLVTESPLAKAQVELLKAQLEHKQAEMEHEENMSRIDHYGNALESAAAPFAEILASVMREHLAGFAVAKDLCADWKTWIETVDAATFAKIPADLADLMHAARHAESADDCRAVLEELRERLKTSAVEVQAALVATLGAARLTALQSLLLKHGL